MQRAHVELANQELVNEAPSAYGGDLTIERDHHRRVDADGPYGGNALLGRLKLGWRMVRQHRHGVRIERTYDSLHATLARALGGSPHDLLVSQMHAVEVAMVTAGRSS